MALVKRPHYFSTRFTDGSDARISVEEFTPIYRNLRKDRRYQKTPEELADCLANFDRDGNGLISVVDLRFILTSCGTSLQYFRPGLAHGSVDGCPNPAVPSMLRAFFCCVATMSTLGEQLTDRETEILIQGQEGSEGKVNIHEFIRRISE